MVVFLIHRPGKKVARAKAGYELYSAKSDDLRRRDARTHPNADGSCRTLVEEWIARQSMCLFFLSLHDHNRIDFFFKKKNMKKCFECISLQGFVALMVPSNPSFLLFLAGKHVGGTVISFTPFAHNVRNKGEMERTRNRHYENCQHLHIYVCV